MVSTVACHIVPFAYVAGLYAEIFPREGEFGVQTKEGGGGREAYVRCYTWGENDTKYSRVLLPFLWWGCVVIHNIYVIFKGRYFPFKFTSNW